DRHNGGEATIISTVWELEDDDREALADEFGDRAVTGSEITKNTRAPGPEAAQIPKSRRIRINSQQSF
ncbi:MAG: hypothetical protein GDA39_05750, partial [Hyphomonadaceae bacterium]|nr:hypothetical protein [Hyphomonadaceae bacterium]